MGLGVAAGSGISVGAVLSYLLHLFSGQLDHRISVTCSQVAAAHQRSYDDYAVAVVLCAFSALVGYLLGKHCNGRRVARIAIPRTPLPDAVRQESSAGEESSPTAATRAFTTKRRATVVRQD